MRDMDRLVTDKDILDDGHKASDRMLKVASPWGPNIMVVRR